MAEKEYGNPDLGNDKDTSNTIVAAQNLRRPHSSKNGKHGKHGKHGKSGKSGKCPRKKCSKSSKTGKSSKSCKAKWTPLENDHKARKIDALSGCDDCVDEISLGFDFRWMGGTNTINKVHVSTNGQILINPGDANRSYSLRPIGTNNAPRIAVTQEDLDLRPDRQVYMKQETDCSIIISYEDVTWHWYRSNKPEISAQAQIFADGSVNICFGAGGIINPYDSMASGIEAGVNDKVYDGPPVKAPLPRYPFDADGVAREWPSEGSCYCFDPCTNTWSWTKNRHKAVQMELS